MNVRMHECIYVMFKYVSIHIIVLVMKSPYASVMLYHNDLILHLTIIPATCLQNYLYSYILY